jgi:hypothetical protein
MNALEIVDVIRRHGVELVVEDGHLIVRGQVQPLPDTVKQELREHKAELLVALGEPLDRTVAGILGDIRPYLSPALQRLPDDRLLALVNWNIITAFEASIAKVRQDG